MGDCPRCGQRLPTDGKCGLCARERAGGATVVLGTPGEIPRAVGQTQVLGSPGVGPSPRRSATAPSPALAPSPSSPAESLAPAPVPAPSPARASAAAPRHAPPSPAAAARRQNPAQQREGQASRAPRAAGRPPERARPGAQTSSATGAIPGLTPWPRRALIWAGIGALALGSAGVVLWATHRSALEAHVVLGENGTQELSVRCDECASGTRVSHREAHAVVAEGQARIPLEPALAPGPQPLSLSLSAGSEQAREVGVQVVVPCRLSPDLDGLSLVPPSWGILVEAHGGTTVVLDGRPVGLDREGRGRVSFAVGPALEGPNARRVRVERLVPFSVTVPGQLPLRGRFPLHVDVVPLQLEAPGESIAIGSDSFMLAGKTLAGASVQVEDHSIVVDREGRFAQRMSVSSVGQRTITVRARAPGLAPRSIAISVRRVADLKEVLADCPRLDANQLAAGSARPATLAGRRVAVEGRVTDLRAEGHATRIALDVPCGTNSCRINVRYGATSGASVGDQVAACGTMASDGPLVAEFVTPSEADR